MKPKSQFRRSSILPANIALTLGLAVAGLSTQSANADATWNGSTGDWNTGANWSTNPPSGNFFLNSGIATLSATSSFTPVDLIIGTGSGTSGRLDQSAGTLALANTGTSGNWMQVGINGGTGTYNLTGTGSLAVGKLWIGGQVYGENGTGTVTINTTGSVTANSTDDFSGWSQYQTSISVGWGASGNGTLNLVNGTVNSPNRAIYVGSWGASGTLNQSGGTINAAGLVIGKWFSNTSSVNVTGGTLNSSWVSLAVSGNGSDVNKGSLNVSGTGTVNSEGDMVVAVGGSGSGGAYGSVSVGTGGVLNVATTTKRWMIVNQYDSVAGTVTVNGGTLNLNANTDLRFSAGGGTGAGIVNLESGAISAWSGNKTGAGATSVVDLNTGGGSVNNTFNLDGGTLTIGQIISSNTSGTRVFNFNGGTLKATAASTAFFASNAASTAAVLGGGGTVNNNGFAITIGQVLSGAGSMTFSDSGSAATTTLSSTNTYTGTTTVNGGTLALGNATNTLSDTGSVVVNGGTLSLGTNSDTVGAVTLASGTITSSTGVLTGTSYAVQSGTISGILGGSGIALGKSTAGTVTITAAQTYTGATTINAGTLVVSAGSVNASSGVTINGSGAKYVYTSTTAGTNAITVTNGTLDGTGTVGAVTVGNGTGGIVTNGNAATTSLTLGSLTFNGAGTLSLRKANDTTSTVALAITGALATTPTNGQITLNLLTSPLWANGNTYNIISYGSFGGADSDFSVGSIAGLGARQSATVGHTSSGSGYITLAIAGDTPYWTGAQSTAWTANAVGGSQNWKLLTAGTGTEFLANDQVLFDDNASGSGTVTVNVSDTDVNPVSMVFNATRNYVVTGSKAITTGTLAKSGTGTLTINTANSFTGGTTISDGAIVAGTTTALGATTGTLAVNGGTLDLHGNSTTVGDFSGTGSGAVVTTNSGAATLTAGTGNSSSYQGQLDDGTGMLSLTKQGAGTLTLTNTNTYSGTTTINAGTLVVDGAGSLGGGSYAGNIVDSGSFQDNSSASQTLSGIISGTGTLVHSGASTLSLSGVNSYSGDTTIGTGATLALTGAGQLGSGTYAGSIFNAGTLNENSSAAQTISGTISGAGSVTKNSAGTLTLSGTNTYTGGTTINNGTLQITTTSGAANSGTFNLGGGNFQVNVGSSNFNYNPTINVTADSTFSSIGSGQINYTGTLAGSGNQLNVSTGTSRLYMNGTVTGISQFNVLSGAMGFDINVGNNRGTAAVNIANGAALWFAGINANPISNNITFNGGTGQGGIGALYYEGGTPTPAALTGTITLAAGDTSVGGQWASDTITLGGQITGSGALTKMSGDTYILTHSNDYSGGTTVAAGILEANNSSALGTGSASISATTGAQLQLGSGVNVANELTINGGGVTAQGALYVPTGDATYSGAINITGATSAGGDFASGSGTLSLTGAITSSSVPVTIRNGTVALSNTGSSYSALNIQQGTAKLGAPNAIPVAATVNLGASGAATLDLAGYNQTLAGITKNTNGATVTNSGSSDSTLTTTGSSTFAGVIQDGTTNKTALTVSSGALTLTGANTFTGAVVVDGGTLYANPANAPTNRALSYVSGITVNSGGTLQSGSNGLFGWDGTQEHAITVNAGGTMTADNGADVGVGTVTLAGGTLTSVGTSTVWGSWRFDDATDKLRVTENSTISAVNVKFGNSSAALEVAAGKTANFTGTITDASSGGTSYLNKTGAGTLALTGTNTYTGATTVNAGTLVVSGSVANSAVTVSNAGTVLASGATGTIGSSVTVNTGAVLAAGGVNVIGTATVGSGGTTMNSGSIFSWDVSGNGTSYDQLQTAAATGSGAIFRVVLADSTQSNAFWNTTETWSNILTTDGSTAVSNWTNIFGSIAVVDNTGAAVDTSVKGYFTANGSSLTWTAVPEPTSALAGLLIGAGLLRRRRSA